MFLTTQDLKVDQTFIPSESQGILVTNINIPEGDLVNLENVLDRIRDLIVSDYFSIENIQYQICATYELRNTATGDVRQWTGSFNPRGNQSNALSQFQQFGVNFNDSVRDAIAPENIYRKLRFYHVETNWVFQKLNSIVISFQSEISLAHPTLMRRSLLVQRNGRKHRSVCSFLLP